MRLIDRIYNRLHTPIDKLKFAIVWALPRWVVELSTVRVWANATTGKFSDREPDGVKWSEAIDVWRRGDGGDGP